MLKAKMTSDDGQEINVFGLNNNEIQKMLVEGLCLCINDNRFTEKPFIIMYGKDQKELKENIEEMKLISPDVMKKMLDSNRFKS